jgi:hypothetical protein
MDAGFKRRAHFLARLADAGEDDLVRAAAGRQDPRQFTAGNDVEAGAEIGEELEDGEVGVGLDRVADQRSIKQAARLRASR